MAMRDKQLPVNFVEVAFTGFENLFPVELKWQYSTVTLNSLFQLEFEVSFHKITFFSEMIKHFLVKLGRIIPSLYLIANRSATHSVQGIHGGTRHTCMGY